MKAAVRSVLGALLLLQACMAPVVAPAGSDELLLDGFPEGTAVAEAEAPDGTTLRGVFVPAGADAPVVLHLLPREASITTGIGAFGGMKQTLATLRELGFASLVLDYRGVGASDGSPSPRDLADDGWAMWQAALERSSGDPSTVVLRATSLGSLVAAELLERGARPAALVLFAPVRTETVAANGARERYGSLLGTLVGAFLRSPTTSSLDDVLERTEVPTLLVAAADDVYLPALERDELVRIAQAAGHRTVVHDGDHGQLTLRAYNFELTALRGGVVEGLLEAEQGFLELYGMP